jgi:predicted DNA-binding antitoxin AbrB/MazE fold protein
MSHTITATYEHGVFVPKTPVDLPEHTVVKLLLPKKHSKKSEITEPEALFLSLRGICRDLADLDSVEMQRKIRSEWRGQ